MLEGRPFSSGDGRPSLQALPGLPSPNGSEQEKPGIVLRFWEKPALGSKAGKVCVGLRENREVRSRPKTESFVQPRLEQGGRKGLGYSLAKPGIFA
jgi:hypothetical protein